MKKTFCWTVVLALFIVFSFSLQLKGEKETRLLIKKPECSTLTRTMSIEELQAKRQRLMEEKSRRQALNSQLASRLQQVPADNTKAIDIEEDTSYTYFQNGLGDVYMTTLCYNAGSTYAAMVEATVSFYDNSHIYLGSDTGWVYGGTNNVQYGSSGYCTNELAPGEYGFFYAWPNVSYNDAEFYSVSFTGEDSTTYLWANATLDYYPAVYYRNTLGLLNFYGDIKNYSTNYVTYYTTTNFAVFNTDNTKVIDVDWNFVDGSTYDTSNSAIYPRTYEPFDLTFLFAQYSQSSTSYLSAFEWYEAYYASLPEVDPPFGTFETPIDGAHVASSIAVTGWALDDSGVDHVKIYRQQGSTLVYIGDATLVEGARPDVAAAFPQYPNNTKAGWGYMMLTNFLPNGGNGTYVIHAVATDVYGKSTNLGAKTIYCDNAHAVKPFGAIDTPTQGGNASGASFINWGWALTPTPKYIPYDGSTINVWVDGMNIGHPNYNNYRADIATLFPGYNNSNGASGYFYLDTTGYTNGVHSIQWTVRDNEGSTDGIGSRYFSINNSSSKVLSGIQFSRAQPGIKIKNISQLNSIPVDYHMPIRIKHGYDRDMESDIIPMDERGMNRISLQELQRVEISLSEQTGAKGYLYSGYMVSGNRLHRLPVGSTLDRQKGIFYWEPGPGFLGKYRLVFLEKRPDGTINKKNIMVEVLPR
jgi:hypothetical protein